jgi:hypothetical protein
VLTILSILVTSPLALLVGTYVATTTPASSVSVNSSVEFFDIMAQ